MDPIQVAQTPGVEALQVPKRSRSEYEARIHRLETDNNNLLIENKRLKEAMDAPAGRFYVSEIQPALPTEHTKRICIGGTGYDVSHVESFTRQSLESLLEQTKGVGAFPFVAMAVVRSKDPLQSNRTYEHLYHLEDLIKWCDRSDDDPTSRCKIERISYYALFFGQHEADFLGHYEPGKTDPLSALYLHRFLTGKAGSENSHKKIVNLISFAFAYRLGCLASPNRLHDGCYRDAINLDKLFECADISTKRKPVTLRENPHATRYNLNQNLKNRDRTRKAILIYAHAKQLCQRLGSSWDITPGFRNAAADRLVRALVAQDVRIKDSHPDPSLETTLAVFRFRELLASSIR